MPVTNYTGVKPAGPAPVTTYIQAKQSGTITEAALIMTRSLPLSSVHFDISHLPSSGNRGMFIIHFVIGHRPFVFICTLANQHISTLILSS